MNPILRLVEDVFSDGAEMTLRAEPRMIFVLHGAISVAGRPIIDGEAWHGDGAAEIVAGPDGAMCWRYELSQSPGDDVVIANGVASRTKLAAPLESLAGGRSAVSRRQRRLSAGRRRPICTGIRVRASAA